MKPSNTLSNPVGRTSFLLWLLVILLILIWGAPALALDLKIATAAPGGSKWMQALQETAGKIEAETGGRVRLRIYGGGVMGNDRSVLRKIRIDQLHGATFTGGELGQLAPVASLYSLPMIFDSLDDVDSIRMRMDPRIAEALQESGFESFGIVEAGFARLMSGEPIARLDDLTGRKIWVPEGDQVTYDFMRALGLAPVSLPLTDVMTGLQTGLIDVIAAPAAGALAFQWHTRIKYVNDLPLVYVYGSLLVTEKAMRQLTDTDRETVRRLLGEAIARLDRESRADELAAFDALIGSGVVLNRTEIEAVKQWRALAGPALKSALGESELARQHRAVKSLLDEHETLAERTERPGGDGGRNN